MTRSLVVRLDSLGDVLVSGPAVRAVAAGSARTSMLVGPAGADAAALLPDVDDLIVWDCPWISADPTAVERAEVDGLIERIARERFDCAVVLTSFHQSALPTALLLRLAGVPRIAAISEDYPGSLLDVRVPPPADAPEPERMLAVAQAAGFNLPNGDDGRLRLGGGLPPVELPLPSESPYVVVHPGASATARQYPAELWREVVNQLAAAGCPVVVTGGKYETALTATVADGVGIDCGGRFEVSELAVVIAAASVIAAANTGPAHIAAAVGTPVVSLFAPVVPARRWAPYGVPLRLLGDQHAACRDSRARECPIAGHPCLSSVSPRQVTEAVLELAGERR